MRFWHNSALFPLYAVVLNWNAPADTIECLASLRLALAAVDGVTRIIVVDNGSSDSSVAQLRQQMPALFDELAPLNRNLGFAGGVNVGIQLAMARGAGSVLLLNNDTTVDQQMVVRLLDTLVKHPETGLAGPVIYYADAPERIWRAADNESAWLPIPRRMADSALAVAANSLVVDYITGCCMLVRAATIAEIGLFDERFFMYFEDADYCRRARICGYSVRCVPAARMWHKVSLSANRIRPTTRYAASWGRVQFYRKHPHGRLAALVHPYIWARGLVVSVRDGLHGEWDLIGPLWRGVYDGYRDPL